MSKHTTFYQIDFSLVPPQERPALRRRIKELDVLVSVEPDKVVTTRYENMFGPCDFIDRIDVAEPGTYAIIRIGGDDE